MSDTPETDTLEIGMDKRDFKPKDKLMPYADLCRKLERENQAMRVLLYEVDEYASSLEDVLHGYEGRRATELRSKINDALYE